MVHVCLLLGPMAKRPRLFSADVRVEAYLRANHLAPASIPLYKQHHGGGLTYTSWLAGHPMAVTAQQLGICASLAGLGLFGVV